MDPAGKAMKNIWRNTQTTFTFSVFFPDPLFGEETRPVVCRLFAEGGFLIRHVGN